MFHTASTPSFTEADAAAFVPMDIICTVTGTAAPQTYQCWAGTVEYATGTVGVAGTSGTASSADGKMQVFVGTAADPFFFNIDGFHAAQAVVEGAEGSLSFDTFGCPTLDNSTAAALRGLLTTNPADGGPAVDHFATFDTLAIAVSLDTTIVTAGGPIVGVWGATYQAP